MSEHSFDDPCNDIFFISLHIFIHNKRIKSPISPF